MLDPEVPRYKKHKKKQRNKPFLIQFHYSVSSWGWVTYARYASREKRDQALMALKKSKKHVEIRVVDL